METDDQRLDRLADLLIKRGLAKSHVVDDKTGIGEFVWTPAGKSFRKHLLRLFDVPNTHPRDVDGHDVMLLIGVILFTGAPEE